MKKCICCEETKDFSLFSMGKRSKDGYRNTCKSCAARKKSEKYHRDKEAGLYDAAHNKHHMLKRNYGIGIDEYNSMLLSQEYGCAICGVHNDSLKRNLAVDHNHDTGQIRGLLCHACNTGIGLFKENPEMLRRSIDYLAYHNK